MSMYQCVRFLGRVLCQDIRKRQLIFSGEVKIQVRVMKNVWCGDREAERICVKGERRYKDQTQGALSLVFI